MHAPNVTNSDVSLTDREDLERDREEIFPESENVFDDGHTRRHTSHRPTHMMTHATVSSDKMSTVIFLPHSISAPPHATTLHVHEPPAAAHSNRAKA